MADHPFREMCGETKRQFIKRMNREIEEKLGIPSEMTEDRTATITDGVYEEWVGDFNGYVTRKKPEKHKHYSFDYKGVRLDPYRILHVYGITHPAHQHAIKKLLRAGNSVKDIRTDLLEVRDTIDRFIQMLDEDECGE